MPTATASRPMHTAQAMRSRTPLVNAHSRPSRYTNRPRKGCARGRPDALGDDDTGLCGAGAAIVPPIRDIPRPIHRGRRNTKATCAEGTDRRISILWPDGPTFREGRHEQDHPGGRGANRPRRPQRKPSIGGRPPGRVDARGARVGLQARGLSGTGADLVLSPLVDGGRRRGRFLVRAGDAVGGHLSAVRHGQEARYRVLSRVRRAGDRRRRTAPLQHGHPGRRRREHRRQVPQGAPSGPCRQPARLSLPAPREAVFRRRRPRIPDLADHGRRDGHVPLQRPALARDLPRPGVAWRGDHPAGLQHAGASALGSDLRQSGRVSQSPVHAGRRLSERLLGGGRGEGRRGGGLRPDRRQRHHRAVGRDRRPMRHQGGRADRGQVRPRSQRAQQGRAPELRRPPAHRALRHHRRTDGGGGAGVRTRLHVRAG